MAGYDTSNPPVKIAEGITGGALWYYSDGDADSVVNGAGYFTDGDDRGMKVGDFMLAFDTAGTGAFLVVTTVVAGGAATTAFGAVA